MLSDILRLILAKVFRFKLILHLFLLFIVTLTGPVTLLHGNLFLVILFLWANPLLCGRPRRNTWHYDLLWKLNTVLW